MTETNSVITSVERNTSCKTPTKTLINKITQNCKSHSENDSPLNQGTIFPNESQNYLKSPEDHDFDRQLSFSNDLTLSQRHDEVSTDHSIEEYKKEPEFEIKKKANNKIFNQSTCLTDLANKNTSGVKLIASPCKDELIKKKTKDDENLEVKKLDLLKEINNKDQKLRSQAAPLSTQKNQFVEKVHPEGNKIVEKEKSFNLDDTFGFIEIKPKTKKSMTRGIQEKKDGIKKRKEKVFIENSGNKEKHEKTTNIKKSVSSSQIITSVLKQVEETKKSSLIQNQNNKIVK